MEQGPGCLTERPEYLFLDSVYWATIILVCVLVAIFLSFWDHAKSSIAGSTGMNWVMKVSGAEALSNVGKRLCGQVEAQVMIRPYLKGMTMSELLASMSGSLACIAGGIPRGNMLASVPKQNTCLPPA
jgi:nucleoside permease NupC